MSPLEPVQPLTERDADGDQVRDRQRQRAIALAESGALLGPQDLAAICNIGLSAFYKHAKRGLYDDFKTQPVLGPKCYSGTKVNRWLKGEPVYEPSFGARRRK